MLDDGKERKDGAYIKYGENHLKASRMLGLSFELCGTYYLSGIGYIFETMAPERQKDILVRLILRSTLVERLFQASQNGNVDLKNFLYMLSESTYVRRSSNIKRLLAYLSIYGYSSQIDRFIVKIII